jgi:hypothetical protein
MFEAGKKLASFSITHLATTIRDEAINGLLVSLELCCDSIGFCDLEKRVQAVEGRTLAYASAFPPPPHAPERLWDLNRSGTTQESSQKIKRKACFRLRS